MCIVFLAYESFRWLLLLLCTGYHDQQDSQTGLSMQPVSTSYGSQHGHQKVCSISKSPEVLPQNSMCAPIPEPQLHPRPVQHSFPRSQSPKGHPSEDYADLSQFLFLIPDLPLVLLSSVTASVSARKQTVSTRFLSINLFY